MGRMLHFQDMDILDCIYSCFSACLCAVVVLFAAAHLASWLRRPSPLKLREDSLVVLTGGCMGIGRHMALQLASLYGCRLVIVDRRQDLFASISAEVEAAGGKCECVEADLGREEAVQELVGRLRRRGHIDLLIYNAGVVVPKRSWETTAAEHRLVMQVNYFTPVSLMQGLAEQLEGGHVAVVASMVAIISGGINYSTYAASKNAIMAYLACRRQETLRDRRTTTYSIGCPYAINTTMFAGFNTRVDWALRVLREDYVGQRLAREFVARKEVCFIYQHQAFLFKLCNFLPTFLTDLVQLALDRSDFSSIRDKHAAVSAAS